MHPVRKKGRGGGSGKAVAPHPDELIGVSPSSECSKPLPGLRTRKAAEAKSSPADGPAYGTSNLAAAVLRSLQREKEERRNVFNPRAAKEDSGDEGTPKIVVQEKSLPGVPQKKQPRSISRGKDSCAKEEKKSRDSVERNQRRSVSAQPIRECRNREPFDCSSKVVPNWGTREAHRGVAKAFLKSARTTIEPSPVRTQETSATKAPSKPIKEIGLETASSNSEEDIAPKEVGVSEFSSALHERLSLLEEKVTQLATDLRDTKELLHASNPINNQVLTDIQMKISNIEKAILTQNEFGSRQEVRSIKTSLENSDPNGTSKPQSHLTVFKDKPALHQKLVESRAALQQKLAENRILLRNKIAALECPIETNSREGEVIAEEFLASLKQSQVRESDMELVKSFITGTEFGDTQTFLSNGVKNSSERKRRHVEPEAESGVLRSSCSYSTADTSASALGNLECDESLDEEVDNNQENAVPVHIPVPALDVPIEDTEPGLIELGSKAAMAGWFVYEAEGILLAHDDGSCSFYDVANMEEKSQYKAPEGLPLGTWRDCWLIRAAGSDGRSNKYVVAASAGTAVDPAFCSWNFYEKTVAAYHVESPSWPTTPSTCSSSDSKDSRISPRISPVADFPLWWYRPCGPLMASGGSGLKNATLYDIRDGDFVMKWDLGRLIATMGYSSPLQWRNKGTLVVAEDEGLSFWDVSSPEAHCANRVNLPGKAIYALHVYNSDGECNGGVRQRISSNDTGGIDGVFATQDAVNILDVRVPSGIGLKIPTYGQTVHSLYTNGDSVYAGVTSPEKSMQCSVQQWCVRKGQPMRVYSLPDAAAFHHLQTEISQVWGNTDFVMAVNGNGLFVFDNHNSRECSVIGSDDLYCPSFDYSGSKVLLISRDRPATWQYWPTSTSWNF